MRTRAIVALLTLAFAAPLSVGAAPSGSPSPASIDETVVFFYYDDIATVVPFYEELLGLEKTMDEEWVKIYRVSPTSSVGIVDGERGYHDASEKKPAMLSIVTREVDDWYAHLRASGTRVLIELPPPGPVEQGEPPIRGFLVEDPGGYTVEFFSWATPPGD